MKASDERADRVRVAGQTPTVERLLRVAAAVADVPIAICFTIDGEQARITASEGLRAGAVDPTVSARRLRLERTRIVPHVGKGPAAPEVAIFNPGTTVLAMVSMPLFGDAGEQVGAVLLADAKPRIDLSNERRVAVLDEVRAMLEWASRPLVEEGPLELELPALAIAEPPIPHIPTPSEVARRRTRSSQHSPRPDAVTGVPDRTYVQKDTERRIERATALGHGMAFVIVSLDRFRRVNDSLGHTLGDQLLRQVAQRLLASVDEVDLVGRRTGDEFIVVIDELGPTRSVMPAVDRIQQSIREPFHVDGHEIVLSACLGMSRYPQDATDAASLLRFSDIALHQAKDEGPGRLKLFDASMQAAARERLDLEHQLREAMRTSQLQLWYQPKYAIDQNGRGALVGAEALMRWNHPQRGMISPGRFIPVAEDSGLIVPIGTWALNEVCRQTRRWTDAGLDVGRVSVNVSGLQFTRHDFVGTVTRALRAASIPPKSLELELTETIVMQDVEKAIARLGEIRGLGVRVSVDDFGTGYSSLAYLQKLPVDVLKIDRSFVQELDREGLPAEQARSLAQAITYLGHQLGLDVLAEGVETKEQLAQLANVGCDEVQGYLFGKPMPADAFERHVRDA